MSPSPRLDDPRACPRCATTLRSEQGYGASGVTYLWRCDCGWSSVRTVAAGQQSQRKAQRSGVYVKPGVQPDDQSRGKSGAGR